MGADVTDGEQRTPSGRPQGPSAVTALERSRSMVVLLFAALVLFTARMGDLSLPSLEDAFYGREAVEMARSGRIYTVTWNGEPTHQHPPLHLWLVARTFDALGERDLAARLPTVVLALGTMLLTWRIGVLTLGRAAAVAGVACLLATPIFVDNARRLMMEVPLTFWIAGTVWVYLEARERPRWQVALAIPLGAAILTKSVLGLMPLLALVGALASEELRAPLRRPWVWIGLALGLAIGASWLAHQWWTQGSGAVASHLLAHVVRRSARSLSFRALRAYPLILLKFFQPVILPGLLGLWLALRRPGRQRAGSFVLGAWILLPVVLYSFSSFRTPRFIFPILPPLALCAGYALVTSRPARDRVPLRRAGSDRRGHHRGHLLVEPVAPHAGPQRRVQAERGHHQGARPRGRARPVPRESLLGDREPAALLRGTGAGAVEPLRPRSGRGGAAPPRTAPDGDQATPPGAPGDGPATGGRPGGAGLGPAAPGRAAGGSGG